jgi:hypothetical protein
VPHENKDNFAFKVEKLETESCIEIWILRQVNFIYVIGARRTDLI